MKKLFLAVTLIGLALTTGAGAAVIVNANNTTSGDDFTNSGTTNTNLATPGAALGTTGWYYNNVRNNGHVGIDDAYPRSGNGSVWFNATQGPSGSSSKADIEYYQISSGTVQVLGTLGNLTALSYDWYRASGGTASNFLAPPLRLYVASPDGTKAGYLVFEPVYNNVYGTGNAAVPTDQWESINVLANDYLMWSTGTLPLTGLNYDSRLKIQSGWMTTYGDYEVYGISSGVGSGWGTFVGAVDNITFGFGGVNTTANFEVPEPATMGLLALGGLGAIIRRRRTAR